MINFGIVFILSLVTNWLDLMTSSWLPLYLTVSWVWVGAAVCIFRSRRFDRWLWIALVHAWQLFYLPWPLILGSFCTVGISTEIYDIVNNRFLHSTNRLVSYLVGALLFAITLVIESLILVGGINWLPVSQVIISTVVLAIIQKYYVRAA